MKKFIVTVLSFAIFSSNVFAADVFVDGEKLDKEAVIIDSSSYLPIRAIAEALGFEVEWNSKTKTINITTKNKQNENTANVSEIVQDDELNGVWFARNNVETPYLYADGEKDENVGSVAGYYIFGSDGMSGYYRSQETGKDTLFTYKKSGNELTVTFKDGKGARKAEIVRTNNIVTALNWQDGNYDNMYFMYLEGQPEFYTSKKLCELALGYYEEQHKYRPRYAQATVGTDNNVNIQLYDIVDDHTSTCDWYTVNPITATGVDITGNPIDISHAPLG